MAGKCPVCGAPMEGTTCDYCGYTEKNPQGSAAGAGNANSFEQPQASMNQQVVIQNTVVNGRTMVVPNVSAKSKTVALVLCILLGYLGVHRFYVGKTGTGVLYLLTLGLFGIGWIVDIIRIATGSFKDVYGLPLR